MIESNVESSPPEGVDLNDPFVRAIEVTLKEAEGLGIGLTTTQAQTLAMAGYWCGYRAARDVVVDAWHEGVDFRAYPNVLERLRRGGPCNDCAAPLGTPHDRGCDVARCLVTGMQAISCGGTGGFDPDDDDEDQVAVVEHDCGDQVWTGEWPGHAECVEFGWWSRFTPERGWERCGPDNPGAGPDLNRLNLEAEWDRGLQRWVLGGPPG